MSEKKEEKGLQKEFFGGLSCTICSERIFSEISKEEENKVHFKKMTEKFGEMRENMKSFEELNNF